LHPVEKTLADQGTPGASLLCTVKMGYQSLSIDGTAAEGQALHPKAQVEFD